MKFKEYFATISQLDSYLFPAWHVSPWVKLGAMIGVCLGIALVINAILFMVKPGWYGKSETKKDQPKPIPHKGIAQKLKEGIPLSKREKTAVGFVQLVLTLVQSIEAIVVACGIAGATMALMPIVFNWSLTFAANFVANFTGAGVLPPASLLTEMVYVFAGLAPTGFCITGFAAAICLAGKIMFADTSKSAVSFFDVATEENDDKE
jgi:hypothetical protein